jgi:A/G-specific adenine glycosylase
MLHTYPLEKIRTLVFSWYDLHARVFPWRKEHPEPYIVLISETMLQQTQTSRVQERLPIFLKEYPTIYDLAKASNATIIRSWEGMGYNNRALRLRDCAQQICSLHGGIIPQDYTTLKALPGIGDYTASAILAFAYHHNIAVVDVNIRRVYSRIIEKHSLTTDVSDEKHVRQFAEMIYPQGQSSFWHQSIMDIGALFCTASSPKCNQCPVKSVCASAHQLKHVPRAKRQEPSFRGKPNRIWRGKIVNMLRQAPTHKPLSPEQVLTGIFPQQSLMDSTPDTLEWLAIIAQGLQRDGMIHINGVIDGSHSYSMELSRD